MELRCGICGNAFKCEPVRLQDLIFQVGDLLVHAEPCYLDALYRLGLK